MADFADWLGEQRQPIIDAFGRAIDGHAHPSTAPGSVIADELVPFFDDVARSLRQKPRRAAAARAPHRRTPSEPRAPRADAAAGVASVVREYGVLRRCILAAAESAGVPLTAAEHGVLADCIDAGIVATTERLAARRACDADGRRAETPRHARERAMGAGAEQDADRFATARQSEEGFRSLVDNLPELTWSARPDGIIDYYNRRWYEYTGTTFETMRGWASRRVYDRGMLRKILHAWRHSLATGEPFEREFRLRGADGTFRWFLTRVRPLYDADGRIVRWVGLNTDIDDRKRTEEALHASKVEADRLNRLKDEFLATVSHELRTPLQAMMGWARILKTEAFSGEPLRKGLDTIERNARVQAQLIEDILDVSGIIAGKVRIRDDVVDVRAFVDAAVQAVTPAARSKGIELTASIAQDVGSIVGDSDRLQQVIWNLLSNSVKFTPAGGRIGIAARRVDSQLTISVADSGRGIDPAFLPYVFDRFRQGDAGINRSVGGLGLGLAIVRHLVELHGGTIQASSGGEGKGSEFAVHLPIRATTRTEAPPKSVGQKAPEVTAALRRVLDGLRVLVVDDEIDARELLVLILEQYGASTEDASSTGEALEKFAGGPFDVLVSDIGMPGEDGYALMRRLRALDDPAVSGIPALALTAYARVEDRRRALAAGYQMHVPKPIEPVYLVNLVAQLAGRNDAAHAQERR